MTTTDEPMEVDVIFNGDPRHEELLACSRCNRTVYMTSGCGCGKQFCGMCWPGTMSLCTLCNKRCCVHCCDAKHLTAHFTMRHANFCT